MAFIDEVVIQAQAGKGGDGVVRWLHTKETEWGGPGGGDGGRGGDIILECVRDLSILQNYRHTKKFNAEPGAAGANFLRHGKDGASVILRVPVGTHVEVPSMGEAYELMEVGQQIVVFKGGPGGFGNNHYKGSTNQNPFQSSPGKPGQGGDILITLKLIADVGLIGFPNAGKSSLLNALTRAKSKVGAYPFTTLEPHLGDFYGHLLADIPGLIEGASAGKGLGAKFLRHIERTRLLVHLVSVEQDSVQEAYKAIRDELSNFGHHLSEKEEVVVLTKTDLLSEEEWKQKAKELEEVAGKEVLTVSVEEEESVKAFGDYLAKKLKDKNGG